eukprot:5096383-Karenia_brevis.AAC.1
MQLWLTSPAWSGATVSTSTSSLQTPQDVMKTWTASEVADFLRSSDLEGLADVCFRNGMNGKDLLLATENVLLTELRLTPFA